MKGSSIDNPIQCDGPWGLEEYVESLRCSSGRQYSYKYKAISVETEPGKVIALAECKLSCKCGKHFMTLYFDTNHGPRIRRLFPNM